MISARDILKKLWQSGVFSKERNFDDIRKEIEKRYKIRYPDSTLANSLKNSAFLMRTRKKRQYFYFQKSSPQENFEYQEYFQPSEIIYEKGQAYDFYIDVKAMIQRAVKEVFIIDSYANEDLFDVYVQKLPSDVSIKILTSPNASTTFHIIVKKFAIQNQGRFEARESKDCHDRAIFVDSGAWVFGQSLKDAGKKPTYLIKIKNIKSLRKIFDDVWNSAKKIH